MNLTEERDRLKKLWKEDEVMSYTEIMGYIDTIYRLRIENQDLKVKLQDLADGWEKDVRNSGDRYADPRPRYIKELKEIINE